MVTGVVLATKSLMTNFSASFVTPLGSLTRVLMSFKRFGSQSVTIRGFCPSFLVFWGSMGSSLSVVLADLFPLLRQLVDWFEDLVVERRVMLKVRSSELETGLSSSDDPMEVEEDTAASGLREIMAFHALGEVCGLDAETLSRCVVFSASPSSFVLLYTFLSSPTLLFVVSCAVKRWPKLKSRYRQSVEAVIEYAKMIDDFDDLVDPRTLALHCLGPETSTYVLRTIEIEKKKKMMLKFNQGVYEKMRAKKNEPLSNLEKRVVRVVEKGVSITPATLVTKMTRTASPTTSVEEIIPRLKKQCVANKGKDKADSHSSNVWDDAGLTLTRAQDAFTTEELKVFFGMSFNEFVGRHIHKLVLGEKIHITSEYLSQKAKATSMGSQVEALEAENSKLRKDLIAAMDEANTAKKKAKEKIKTIAAMSVEAFQQIEEYNTVLFSWYYKGFELLRWYLVKYSSDVDLENLDLEEVNKEMAVDKASQSFALEDDTLENALIPPPAGGDKVAV
ncbi:hypothetical protein SO802_001224 [Lithocarpus litseifolius]|uniref:Uncharacterized protein n=1 Tax=Lithocarpus litseifolius TaxID=425828 RepID=A0AAW2DY10_9ROSI